MSIFEAPQSTWDKRFKARHYSYRDFHRVTTSVLTEVEALALFARNDASVYYAFGTNARAIHVDNWPQLGDWTIAMTCYARKVAVKCTQDVWVRLVSLNPRYLTLLAQGYTASQISGMGVSQTILEVEQLVDANDLMTFYPTYGVAIVFRADSVAGTLKIYAEGNVEGAE